MPDTEHANQAAFVIDASRKPNGYRHASAGSHGRPKKIDEAGSDRPNDDP